MLLHKCLSLSLIIPSDSSITPYASPWSFDVFILCATSHITGKWRTSSSEWRRNPSPKETWRYLSALLIPITCINNGMYVLPHTKIYKAFICAENMKMSLGSWLGCTRSNLMWECVHLDIFCGPHANILNSFNERSSAQWCFSREDDLALNPSQQLIDSFHSRYAAWLPQLYAYFMKRELSVAS